MWSATTPLFLSTLSLRRATRAGWRPWTKRRYFYPRSPCGERRCQAVPLTVVHTFLSTLSLRRATPAVPLVSGITRISIHALLAESDGWFAGRAVRDPHFYPRSPCGERRGASRASSQSRRHFYPRSPCGERRVLRIVSVCNDNNFYPRSPCGERRCSSRWRNSTGRYFYPRSPCGERHDVDGGDLVHVNFYPRSPCGERRKALSGVNKQIKFLSTLSLRRATNLNLPSSPMERFLSTLSLRRAT